VAGLIVLKVFPLTELTNSPLMKRRVSILLLSIVMLLLLDFVLLLGGLLIDAMSATFQPPKGRRQ
jgi:hypothetical protein